MARKVAKSTLQASTIQIINTIRENASYEYQQNVPVISKASEIPTVGQIIYGTPAFANQFINALVNRIAFVRTQSMIFNNPYSRLKKGLIDYGETIEEIFVQVAKAVDYNPEKAANREFQRTMPNVLSIFHTMNWRVMYPVTIQNNDLKLAFLSENGVTDLIAKIVDQVYRAAEVDEFLLFKYLLIKSISHGKMKPVSIGDGTVADNAAIAFRGMSNIMQFPKTEYNEAGVMNNTPKDKQVIFMDSMYNAQYDVKVLSAAFNMNEAEYMGSLFLIDDWTTFDNERFEQIRAASDGIEEVTAAELALMKDVKAVLVDEDWFQFYDNLEQFTETYVASGLYWNYFYHDWKTVSYSPFANAVVFVTDTATISNPTKLTVEITGKDTSEIATVFTLDASADGASLQSNAYNFVQTEQLTTDGIAIQKYGAVIIPASASEKDITLVATIGNDTYTATTTINAADNVGGTVELTKG